MDDRARRLLDRLPTEPRERLTRLIFEADGLMSASRDAQHRRNALRDEIDQQRRYIETRMKAGPVADDDGSVRIANDAIKFKSQELGDLDRANADRHARLQPVAALVRRALDAIAAVPASKVLQPAKHERPNVRGSHADAVDRVRSRIASLKARRAEIEQAPLPIALAKEAATAQIEALAERGRPDLSGLIADGYSIGWPKSSEMAGGTPDDVALTIFAFVHRAAITTAIHRQIEQEASDEGAMAPADRDAALKKVNGEIEAAERTEAALIDDAREHGVIIECRGDADVFAVLAISRDFADAPPAPSAPYRSRQINREPIAAPIHSAPLMPEPARRDPVWS
jgi:hypothetical protein